MSQRLVKFPATRISSITRSSPILEVTECDVSSLVNRDVGLTVHKTNHLYTNEQVRSLKFTTFAHSCLLRRHPHSTAGIPNHDIVFSPPRDVELAELEVHSMHSSCGNDVSRSVNGA